MATASRYRKPDPRIGKPRFRPRRPKSAVYVTMDTAVFDRLKLASGTLGVLDKAVQREFADMVRESFTDPLANYMRVAGVAFGRHGPRLSKTIQSLAPRNGMPGIRIGSLAEPTWAGAEFGGQRGTMSANRKDAQSMRWPNKSGRDQTRKIIYRRQTMQFLPHLGGEGYIVFPTWRKVDRPLSQKLVNNVDAFIAAVTEV